MSDVCPVCMTNIDTNASVCPVCGFRLAGATVEFAPIKVDEVGKGGKQVAATAVSLRVVRGPQTGVVHPVEGDVLTIGRSPHCSIFLNDMTVSRLHATIERIESNYVIRDEKSFNGVWVNNVNVEAKVLDPGDMIQIGTFCLRYEEN